MVKRNQGCSKESKDVQKQFDASIKEEVYLANTAKMKKHLSILIPRIEVNNDIFFRAVFRSIRDGNRC